ILAAGKADHDPVALLDHVVVLDGLADLTIQAFFQFSGGDGTGLHKKLPWKWLNPRILTPRRPPPRGVTSIFGAVPHPAPPACSPSPPTFRALPCPEKALRVSGNPA